MTSHKINHLQNNILTIHEYPSIVPNLVEKIDLLVVGFLSWLLLSSGSYPEYSVLIGCMQATSELPKIQQDLNQSLSLRPPNQTNFPGMMRRVQGRT